MYRIYSADRFNFTPFMEHLSESGPYKPRGKPRYKADSKNWELYIGTSLWSQLCNLGGCEYHLSNFLKIFCWRFWKDSSSGNIVLKSSHISILNQLEQFSSKSRSPWPIFTPKLGDKMFQLSTAMEQIAAKLQGLGNKNILLCFLIFVDHKFGNSSAE